MVIVFRRRICDAMCSEVHSIQRAIKNKANRQQLFTTTSSTLSWQSIDNSTSFSLYCTPWWWTRRLCAYVQSISNLATIWLNRSHKNLLDDFKSTKFMLSSLLSCLLWRPLDQSLHDSLRGRSWISESEQLDNAATVSLSISTNSINLLSRT